MILRTEKLNAWKTSATVVSSIQVADPASTITFQSGLDFRDFARKYWTMNFVINFELEDSARFCIIKVQTTNSQCLTPLRAKYRRIEPKDEVHICSSNEMI